MSKWPSIALDELFEIARGGSPRPIDAFITDDPNGINWIMIGDASEHSKYITKTKKRIRKEGVSRSRLVKPGDFLLTNSMSFGKPYIMKTHGCIHDGWLVLTPRKSNVDPDFFYHLLGSKNIYSEFERLAAGATVKNLNIALVRKVRISLPPIEDQRRIAAILDQAEALQAKRRQALAKFDTLTQSLFLEAFSSQQVQLQKWPIAPLSSLGKVSTGRTPPGEMEGMFNGPVPFITPGDLDGISSQPAKRTLTLGGSLQSRIARAGASAVCCIGATIGKMGLLAIDSAFNQQINVVEWGPHIDDIYGFFALTQLKGEIAQRGASTTLPILKKSAFEQLFLPVPPLEFQIAFRKKVEALIRVKTTTIDQETSLEDLFRSLQAKAFQGAL